MAIISIIVILVLLYLAYKVIRFVTKSFITAEVKNESSKFTIKIKDWFVWNVQINNEKGTAGGNIKINFPIKSALLIRQFYLLFGIGQICHSLFKKQ